MAEKTEFEIAQLHKEQQDRIFADLMNSQSALWGALLAANGIVVGVLSIIIALQGSTLPPWTAWISTSLIFTTVLAIISLLCSFRLARDHHMHRFRAVIARQTKDELKDRKTAAVARASCRRRWLKCLEGTAVLMSLLNLLALIAFALISQRFQP